MKNGPQSTPTHSGLVSWLYDRLKNLWGQQPTQSGAATTIHAGSHREVVVLTMDDDAIPLPFWTQYEAKQKQDILSALEQGSFGKSNPDALSRLLSSNKPDNDSALFLNDTIIDAYFKSLVASQSRSVFAMSPLWLQRNAEYCSNILKHPKNMELFHTAECILCPINQGQHWYLAFVTKKDNAYQITMLDTLNRYREVPRIYDDFEAKIKNIFNMVIPNISWEHTVRPIVRKQNNGYDCGPAICYYGMLAGRNAPLPTVDSPNEEWDYSPFRVTIAKTILETNRPEHHPTSAAAQSGTKRKADTPPPGAPQALKRKPHQ